MTDESRVIIRKHETIPIPDGMTGTPVRDYFKGSDWALGTMPEYLEAALVYEIDGKTYIARQD